MKITSIIFMCLLTTKAAYSTTYPMISLDSLVEKSNHIFVAKIVRIEVIDRNGKQITAPDASTSRNTIKYHLKVDLNNILKTSLDKLPKEITVSNSNKYHGSVSRLQKFIGTARIFLLSSQFSPVYTADWIKPISEKETIFNLINNQPKQRLRTMQKNN